MLPSADSHSYVSAHGMHMTWQNLSFSLCPFFGLGQLSLHNTHALKDTILRDKGISLKTVAFGGEVAWRKIVNFMSLRFPASDFAFEEVFA